MAQQRWVAKGLKQGAPGLLRWQSNPTEVPVRVLGSTPVPSSAGLAWSGVRYPPQQNGNCPLFRLHWAGGPWARESVAARAKRKRWEKVFMMIRVLVVL